MFTILFLPLAVSLFNILPVKYFLQEITSSASLYLLCHHLFICLVFPWLKFPRRRKWRVVLAGLYLVSISFYVWKLLPFYLPVESGSSYARGEDLRLYYHNVNTSSTAYDVQRKRINEASPDVVALLELNQSWASALKLEENYPYHLVEAREDNFGIALYSKFPFGSTARIEKADDMVPVIFAPVLVKGEEVLVVLMHTHPPMNQAAYHRSRVIFRRVATALRHYQGRALVAGDFNSSPFSDFYRRFLKGAEMSHTWWGRGYRRTWNPRNPLLHFMIDHVLYKGALDVIDARRLADTGSDHFPLFTSFAIR